MSGFCSANKGFDQNCPICLRSAFAEKDKEIERLKGDLSICREALNRETEYYNQLGIKFQEKEKELNTEIDHCSGLALILENKEKKCDKLKGILESIYTFTQYNIPYYAYRDNQAACEMAYRISQIAKQALEGEK